MTGPTMRSMIPLRSNYHVTRAEMSRARMIAQ